MWYSPDETNKIKKVEEQKGPNGTLLSLLTKKIVKRILFSKGEYRIYDEDVEVFTRKILNQIQKSYGDIEKIRYKIPNTELLPIIEKIAKQIVK